MEIRRVWSMPSKHTFLIPPIQELLKKYVGNGLNWFDPFAGENSMAQFTNDLNPHMPTREHLDALDFINSLEGFYDGALFDPPYSLHQMKECYDSIGRKMSGREATEFYGDIRKAISKKLKLNSIAISFGWNSIGMGKTHGFEVIEILLVCHGRAHNDTIVTVDRKIQSVMELDA